MQAARSKARTANKRKSFQNGFEKQSPQVNTFPIYFIFPRMRARSALDYTRISARAGYSLVIFAHFSLTLIPSPIRKSVSFFCIRFTDQRYLFSEVEFEHRLDKVQRYSRGRVTRANGSSPTRNSAGNT